MKRLISIAGVMTLFLVSGVGVKAESPWCTIEMIGGYHRVNVNEPFSLQYRNSEGLSAAWHDSWIGAGTASVVPLSPAGGIPGCPPEPLGNCVYGNVMLTSPGYMNFTNYVQSPGGTASCNLTVSTVEPPTCKIWTSDAVGNPVTYANNTVYVGDAFNLAWSNNPDGSYLRPQSSTIAGMYFTGLSNHIIFPDLIATSLPACPLEPQSNCIWKNMSFTQPGSTSWTIQVKGEGSSIGTCSYTMNAINKPAALCKQILAYRNGQLIDKSQIKYGDTIDFVAYATVTGFSQSYKADMFKFEVYNNSGVAALPVTPISKIVAGNLTSSGQYVSGKFTVVFNSEGAYSVKLIDVNLK